MKDAASALLAMQHVIDAARVVNEQAVIRTPAFAELSAAIEALGERGADEVGAEVREYVAQVFENISDAGGTHIDDDPGTSAGLELSPEQCRAVARRVRALEGEIVARRDAR